MCVKPFPSDPFRFLSCSADGTIHMFDIRERHQNRRRTPLLYASNSSPGDSEEDPQEDSEDEAAVLIPQALGGGRLRRRLQPPQHYRSLHQSLACKLPRPIFSMDLHPNECQIVAASEDSRAWIMDLRKTSTNGSFLGALTRPVCSVKFNDLGLSVTGAVFSPDGDQVAASVLNDSVYTFQFHPSYFSEFEIKEFDMPSALSFLSSLLF